MEDPMNQETPGDPSAGAESLPPMDDDQAKYVEAALKRQSKPGFFQVLTAPKNRKGLIVIGGILGFVAIVWLTDMSSGSGHKNPNANAHAVAAPEGAQFEAGGKASQQYTQIFRSHQMQQEEQAKHSGKTFAPTVLGSQPVSLTVSTQSPPPSKPVEKPETVTIPDSAPKPKESPEDAAMVKYQILEAKALLANWAGSPSGIIEVAQNSPAPVASSTESAQSNKETSAASTKKSQAQQMEGANLVGAGNLYYAVIDDSMNSDRPSPVLATMENGPLKGATLLGHFDVTHHEMVARFTVATFPNKTSIPINAIAVNPHTNNADIATSVNHHTLERFGLLLGGAFLQGFGQAVMTSGTTTTGSLTGLSTNTISPRDIGQNALAALGQVGQTLGQIGENDYSQIRTTFRRSVGTGIGVLFLKSVPASLVTKAMEGESATSGLTSAYVTGSPAPAGKALPPPMNSVNPMMENPGPTGYYGQQPYAAPVYPPAG